MNNNNNFFSVDEDTNTGDSYRQAKKRIRREMTFFKSLKNCFSEKHSPEEWAWAAGTAHGLLLAKSFVTNNNLTTACDKINNAVNDSAKDIRNGKSLIVAQDSDMEYNLSLGMLFGLVIANNIMKQVNNLHVSEWGTDAHLPKDL
jgi:hypothetical protein